MLRTKSLFNTMLREILEILFKYKTDNSEERPNSEVLPCLKEIKEFLEAKNIHVELQEYEVKSKTGEVVKHANLLAYNPSHQGKFILMQGHVDTVPFGENYQYLINNNQVIGRGAVDMKGPLAGIINAFINLYQIPDLKNAPALLITSDEEVNPFLGIKKFLEQSTIPIVFAINGEPTNLTVCTKFRGVAIYELEQKGSSGHSSSTDNDFLIERALGLFNNIKLFLEESRKVKDPDLGETIAALTVINAGVKSNQLPERLRISFNLRTVTKSEIYDNLFKKIIEVNLDNNTIVDKKYFEPTLVVLTKDTDVVIKQAFDTIGHPYQNSIMSAFTEASLLSQSGVPTIICGPGSMTLAHVDPNQEVINLRDIEKYSNLLVSLVKNPLLDF